jgi:hypothetical protein
VWLPWKSEILVQSPVLAKINKIKIQVQRHQFSLQRTPETKTKKEPCLANARPEFKSQCHQKRKENPEKSKRVTEEGKVVGKDSKPALLELEAVLRFSQTLCCLNKVSHL